MEIVQRAPDVCHVRIARPVDPITSTWHGGAGLAQHPHINQFCVNKSEYEEYGSAWVAHKFSSPSES
jgi:actin-related protein 6